MATAAVRVTQGEAHIGGHVVPVQPAAEDGELRIGGDAGCVLRPVRFVERSRIVHRALAALAPVDELAAAVLDAATVTDGDVEQPLAEVLAMHLAGAGSGGPCFAETTLLLARSLGWGPDALEALDAAEADRLAGQLREVIHADDGWQRIVFDVAGVADPAAMPIELVRAALADDLLARASAPPSSATLDEAPITPAWDDPAGRPAGRTLGAATAADHRASGPNEAALPAPATITWPTTAADHRAADVLCAPTTATTSSRSGRDAASISADHEEGQQLLHPSERPPRSTYMSSCSAPAEPDLHPLPRFPPITDAAVEGVVADPDPRSAAAGASSPTAIRPPAAGARRALLVRPMPAHSPPAPPTRPAAPEPATTHPWTPAAPASPSDGSTAPYPESPGSAPVGDRRVSPPEGASATGRLDDVARALADAINAAADLRGVRR